MKKKNLKKLCYLDSKGALYSNGIKRYDQDENTWAKDYIPNYNLVENCNELQNILNKEEETYESIKREMDTLVKKKDLLNWNICNNTKKLSMKRSEKKLKVETKNKLEAKLKELKNKTKMYKFEYDTLEAEVNKMEEDLEKKMDLKSEIEAKFNRCLNKKDEYLKDITKERVGAFKERRKRQIQLRKLLLIIKQENNKNYNIEYLKKYEKNLMDEITSYRNYKTFETNAAMNLIKMHTPNDTKIEY
ncbi:hypothetical protein YYC_05001 [Plasmodium yoelii 17X]|uniref:Uncharacterized protein n=4 Tax=Plasmodium yoelii TaxID=5861 RepID=A0AAE9WQ70_PLAYO|nr:conserved Plasmodium protein, unknown function [Plasmodium yoelii]EAA21342.1 hypothetical protein [Plasmodium yoelii yoelii]ETB57186.1 hypothetical protein YYC_05001 [Plasmodium yoelii 17X]WBY55052.1 hypothetical protein Py17XNL_000303694 [Plasmodium yoelii yoelii]CDU16312.1 conserved Plasmodium protein, unknown function [Plasmodium yoelii]VTZ72582.1 conserved Plasmodium protein, unknown function [Plasmodium yoelii]|eukprot:XP_729777.1 conserved Plasmodium protein, unknown function [Plasmodium yoelii]